MGSSLQLVDPHQDNWRAGNWAASVSSSGGSSGPQWVHFQTNGVATSSRLNLYLLGPGFVYVDDLQLVAGSVPEVGANLLTNGNFESPLTGSWSQGPDYGDSGIVTAIKHSGASGLAVVAEAGGNANGDAIYQDITPPLTIGQTYSLSFWYLQTTNLAAPDLMVELSGSGVSSGPIDPRLASSALTGAAATPGSINSVAAVLPVFPPLWINELQAHNLTGITNSAGQHAPWIELYNPSSNPVALGGLCLSTNYSSLTAWPFPSNAVIQAGEFKVIFADGQTSLTTTNELHAGFILPGGTGSVALSRLYNGQPQVLDYLDYTNLTPNHSFGSLPDGQAFSRQEFFTPTPGGANVGNPVAIAACRRWSGKAAKRLQNPPVGSAPRCSRQSSEARQRASATRRQSAETVPMTLRTRASTPAVESRQNILQSLDFSHHEWARSAK